MITNTVVHNDAIIELLYPTPIYIKIAKNVSQIQKELDVVIDTVSFDGAPKSWGDSVDVTDLTLNVVDKYNLSLLNGQINSNILNYCEFLNFKPKSYKMNSWFARTSENNLTHVHNHTYFDLAGVYYYKTTGDDGDLFFMPDSQITNGICYQEFAQRWDHQPMAGKMLIFPGWMLHGVKMNKTKSDRISLAFSVLFER
jgi:hypothetical protein